MIRVLIVDDHPFVRTGVSRLLSQADGIVVVGECVDGDEVLMDIRMPGTSGLIATRDLLAGQPRIRVLMLTASITGATVDAAVRAGAVGYLLKGGDPDALLAAVRTVAVGETAWPGDPTRWSPGRGH